MTMVRTSDRRAGGTLCRAAVAAGVVLAGLLLAAPGCRTSPPEMPELDLVDEPDTDVRPPEWYEPRTQPPLWDLGPEPEFGTAEWREWLAVRYSSQGLVREIARPAPIDGTLGAPFWRDAAFPTAFLDADGEPAEPSTQLYMAYDGGTLYLGARMQEPRPANLVAHVGPDQEAPRLDGDDHIEIHLAPEGVGPDAGVFLLRINSRGAVESVTTADPAWSPQLEARAAVADAAWTVELAVPLEELGADPSALPGSVWACRAIRRRYAGRRLEATAWTRPRGSAGGEPTWGHVRFEGGDEEPDRDDEPDGSGPADADAAAPPEL